MAYGATLTLPTITGGPLTNFQVCLRNDDFPTAAIDGGATSIDNGGGNLICYEDDTKAQQLALHVERFVTGGTPDVEVYVMMTSADSSDTIYIEADDTQTSQPAASSTYGSENATICDLQSFDGGATDISANDNDGTANGGLTIGGSSFSGGYDASDMDGTNDYIDITTETNLSYTATDDVAVFCLIKTNDTGRSVFIGDWNFNSSLNLELRDDGSYRAYIDSISGGIKDYDSGSDLVDDNAEHHVGLRWDGGVLDLFKNGVKDSTVDKNADGTLTGSIRNSGTLKFGADNRSSKHYHDGLFGLPALFSGSNVPSDDYITAWYDNISASSNWVTVGSWADSGGGDTSVSASTDALTLTENAATITLNVNVSTNVDVLTLTEYQASIGTDTNVSASTDTLTLTEYQSSITLDVAVNTNLDTLTLTENQASVALDVNITTNLDTLTLTEYAANIQAGENVNVNTNVDALTLTEQQASIANDVNVTTNVDSLTVSTNQATIDLMLEVLANTDTLTLTTYQSTLTRNVNVTAANDALTLTEYAATVVDGGTPTPTTGIKRYVAQVKSRRYTAQTKNRRYTA